MITIDIPGMGRLALTYALFDLNGTLTTDGVLIPGVAERMARLRERLEVSILTADTRGKATEIAEALGVSVARVQRGSEAAQKASAVHTLGASQVVAVGNGRNDADMLRQATIGIVVLGAEGAAGPTLMAADLVVTHINDALDALLDDTRLLSSLRG